jgi:hypothetical protein
MLTKRVTEKAREESDVHIAPRGAMGRARLARLAQGGWLRRFLNDSLSRGNLSEFALALLVHRTVMMPLVCGAGCRTRARGLSVPLCALLASLLLARGATQPNCATYEDNVGATFKHTASRMAPCDGKEQRTPCR